MQNFYLTGSWNISQDITGKAITGVPNITSVKMIRELFDNISHS
jgi:hypothetical protein